MEKLTTSYYVPSFIKEKSSRTEELEKELEKKKQNVRYHESVLNTYAYKTANYETQENKRAELERNQKEVEKLEKEIEQLQLETKIGTSYPFRK